MECHLISHFAAANHIYTARSCQALSAGWSSAAHLLCLVLCRLRSPWIIGFFSDTPNGSPAPIHRDLLSRAHWIEFRVEQQYPQRASPDGNEPRVRMDIVIALCNLYRAWALDQSRPSDPLNCTVPHGALSQFAINWNIFISSHRWCPP